MPMDAGLAQATYEPAAGFQIAFVDVSGSRRRQRPPKLAVQAVPDQAPDHQAREFAAAFRGFLDWVHSSAVGAGEGDEVSALVRDFLEPGGAHHSVVTRE